MTRSRGAGLALWVFVAACGGKGDEVPPIELDPAQRAAQPRPEGAYEAVEGFGGRRVTFRARWSGDSSLPPIPVLQHREECGATQPHPVLKTGPGGELADVVVWLSDVRRGKPIPRGEPRLLDQVGCRYVPHVLALAVGDQLAIANSDAVLHNVHARRGGRDWMNLGQPAAEPRSLQLIDAPGISRIVCDAGHPWMLAWLHAFEHPYYGVSGDAGEVELEDVPPGEHPYVAWHEGVRVIGSAAGRPVYAEPMVLRGTVRVEEGATVELVFPPPEAPAAPPAPVAVEEGAPAVVQGAP